MINPKVPSNRQIKKLVRNILFGRNIFCPKCHSFKIVCYQKRYRCSKCDLRFSLFSYTYLNNLKLSLKLVLLIIWCFVNQIPVKQSRNLTGISEKGVRHWSDLLRRQLKHIDSKLKGTIQIDEVYLGGWKGKAIIAGKEINTKEIRFHICPRYEPYVEDIYNFFKSYVTPKSTVFTDSSPLYPRICRMFFCYHRRDIHKKFEFHLTSEIEGLFGVMRTFIRRMYHHITVKNFPEYLMEFQYRFSRKIYFSSVDQFLTKTLKLLTTG